MVASLLILAGRELNFFYRGLAVIAGIFALGGF